MTDSKQNFNSTTSNMLAGKPVDANVEFGTGGVKVNVNVNIIERIIRKVHGVDGKSEAYHSMKDEARSRVNNANSTLKSNINAGDKAGVIKSLNDLAAIYEEQAKLSPNPEIKRERIYNANNYKQIAREVKSGGVLLQRLKDNVDELGSVNNSNSNQISSAKLEQYNEIVSSYTDKNGKVDLVSLNRDMKNNSADQETINGVNSLVTPDMQLIAAQSQTKAQNTL